MLSCCPSVHVYLSSFFLTIFCAIQTKASYQYTMVPARHTDVGRADAFRELDTHKVVYCFGHSNKEVVPENSLPEIASHDAPELLYPAAGFSIDDKFNTTPAPKNYERPRSRFRFWSNWSARRRWWAARFTGLFHPSCMTRRPISCAGLPGGSRSNFPRWSASGRTASGTAVRG